MHFGEQIHIKIGILYKYNKVKVKQDLLDYVI